MHNYSNALYFTPLLALGSISLSPFTPAAAAELRELSTDRPDTTESTHTVDAGHFQFELEVANWERDGSSRTWNFAEANLKFGLNASTDLQVVLPLYSRIHGGSEGYGDTTIRLKHNLWGNDDGDTALAIMPFLKFPTAHGDLGNGKWEGGLIVPFSFSLPGGWDSAVMAEVDAEANEVGNGYHAVIVTSATTSHGLTENTACFFELVSVLSTESGADLAAYFNHGYTWSFTKNWQLDGGIRVGLNAASADFTPFLGLSAKF